MEKAIEFNVNQEQLREYLEECLTEQNVNYEMKIEERWIEGRKQASKYYNVYCLYVNKNNLKNVEKLVKKFENGKIVTSNIEELNNSEESKSEEKEDIENWSRAYNVKKFIKYYFLALLLIGIAIILIAVFVDN